MQRLFAGFVCVLGLCAAPLAWAEQRPLTPQFTACMSKPDSTTQSMVECIAAETKLQDARLNQAYQALRRSVGPKRQQQLQQAQRAWIRFRDANCAFYYDPDGGSLARINANDCVMTMTAQRAAELQGLLR